MARGRSFGTERSAGCVFPTERIDRQQVDLGLCQVRRRVLRQGRSADRRSGQHSARPSRRPPALRYHPRARHRPARPQGGPGRTGPQRQLSHRGQPPRRAGRPHVQAGRLRRVGRPGRLRGPPDRRRPPRGDARECAKSRRSGRCLTRTSRRSVPTSGDKSGL